MFKNINWNYVFGLCMGVAITKVSEKIVYESYTKGYQAGVQKCTDVLKESIDDMKEKIHEQEEEES